MTTTLQYFEIWQEICFQNFVVGSLIIDSTKIFVFGRISEKRCLGASEGYLGSLGALRPLWGRRVRRGLISLRLDLYTNLTVDSPKFVFSDEFLKRGVWGPLTGPWWPLNVFKGYLWGRRVRRW